ncbi:MAG: DUF3859 domain-containing protein [Rubellimicrobium sp.]|nr:DUF3859 domain-containing protein [Rubellimicrobium sp.]
MRTAITGIALIWLAATAAAEGDVVGRAIGSFEAGVFCAPPTIGTRPSPETVAGTTHVVDVTPEFLSNSRLVPAEIGFAFGVLARSKSADLWDVTMVVTHPPMGPEGTTEQRFDTFIGADLPSMTYYQFDHESELLPGRWTLEARDGESVVYRASFTVLPPHEVPALAGVCSGPVPLS